MFDMNMYELNEDVDFNERKLQKIKTEMPIFAVRFEYENVKANIGLGLENANDEITQKYLKAYEERLAQEEK